MVGLSAGLLGVASCFATIDESLIDGRTDGATDAGPEASVGLDGASADAADASDFPVDAGCGGDVCQPVVVASGLEAPEWLAVDSTYVYVVESSATGGVRIKRALKGGTSQSLAGTTGLVATIAASIRPVGALVVTSEPSLYWTIADPAGGVFRCGLPTCVPTSFKVTTSPLFLATDNTRLYWSQGGPAQSLRSCALGPSCPSDFVIAQPSFGVEGLALVNATLIYLSELDGLLATPADGGQTRTVYSAFNGQRRALAASTSAAYWLQNGVEIVVCPLTGCAAPSHVASAKGPSMLALDTKRLYWPNGGDAGGIYGCSLAGCGITGPGDVLAADQGQPFAVALDDTKIYWTDRASGEIRSLVKP